MSARWTTAAAVYLRPRLLVVLAMGFASGLPLLLTLSTLSYWLAKLGVDKTTIGLAALLGLPYTLKFLWAPLLDRAPPPGLRRLGRRRGWLLPIQGLLALAVWALGHTDPLAAPLATGLVALRRARCCDGAGPDRRLPRSRGRAIRCPARRRCRCMDIHATRVAPRALVH